MTPKEVRFNYKQAVHQIHVQNLSSETVKFRIRRPRTNHFLYVEPKSTQIKCLSIPPGLAIQITVALNETLRKGDDDCCVEDVVRDSIEIYGASFNEQVVLMTRLHWLQETKQDADLLIKPSEQIETPSQINFGLIRIKEEGLKGFNVMNNASSDCVVKICMAALSEAVCDPSEIEIETETTEGCSEKEMPAIEIVSVHATDAMGPVLSQTSNQEAVFVLHGLTSTHVKLRFCPQNLGLFQATLECSWNIISRDDEEDIDEMVMAKQMVFAHRACFEIMAEVYEPKLLIEPAEAEIDLGVLFFNTVIEKRFVLTNQAPVMADILIQTEDYNERDEDDEENDSSIQGTGDRLEASGKIQIRFHTSGAEIDQQTELKLPVAPKETLEVVFQLMIQSGDALRAYTPLRSFQHEACLKAFERQSRIVISDEHQGLRYMLKIKATAVLPVVSLSTHNVDFGENIAMTIAQGRTALRFLKISDVEPQEIILKNASLELPVVCELKGEGNFHIVPSTSRIEANQHAAFKIMFKPSRVGAFHQRLEAVARCSRTGRVLDRIPVYCRATVAATLPINQQEEKVGDAESLVNEEVVKKYGYCKEDRFLRKKHRKQYNNLLVLAREARKQWKQQRGVTGSNVIRTETDIKIT